MRRYELAELCGDFYLNIASQLLEENKDPLEGNKNPGVGFLLFAYYFYAFCENFKGVRNCKALLPPGMSLESLERDLTKKHENLPTFHRRFINYLIYTYPDLLEKGKDLEAIAQIHETRIRPIPGRTS